MSEQKNSVYTGIDFLVAEFFRRVAEPSRGYAMRVEVWYEMAQSYYGLSFSLWEFVNGIVKEGFKIKRGCLKLQLRPFWKEIMFTDQTPNYIAWPRYGNWNDLSPAQSLKRAIQLYNNKHWTNGGMGLHVFNKLEIDDENQDLISVVNMRGILLPEL